MHGVAKTFWRRLKRRVWAKKEFVSEVFETTHVKRSQLETRIYLWGGSDETSLSTRAAECGHLAYVGRLQRRGYLVSPKTSVENSVQTMNDLWGRDINIVRKCRQQFPGRVEKWIHYFSARLLSQNMLRSGIETKIIIKQNEY